MDRSEFERIVEAALDGLPEPFASRLDNIAIVVEAEAGPEELNEAGLSEDDELFGLYVGVPLTDRVNYHMVLPDRILIFQGPHERHVAPADLPAQIQKTVIHEIAHFFGIDDERLEAMGLG